MGRSSPEPALRTLVGARLTVTRFCGHLNPLEMTAARTRSRDSRQDASGSPTMVKDGRPVDTCTSTDIGCPCTPTRVAEWTIDSTASSPIPFPFDGSRSPAAERNQESNGGVRPSDGERRPTLLTLTLPVDASR